MKKMIMLFQACLLLWTIPEPGATNLFADVPDSHWAAAWINQLYAEGITGGCSTTPLQFCPEGNVTRSEMAVFLLKAIHGATIVPLALVGFAFLQQRSRNKRR